MKKTFSILLVFVIVFLPIFSGCHGQSNGFKVQIIDATDTLINSGLDFDNSIWLRTTYKDPDAEEKISIDFFGETVDMTYHNTFKIPVWCDPMIEYRGDIGSFWFDRDGNLFGYLLTSYSQDISENVLSVEECELIALKHISNLSNADLADYKKTVTYDEHLKRYDIVFKKYIGDYPTEDYAEVIIKDNGRVSTVMLRQFGKINASEIPEFDVQQIEDELKKQIDPIVEKMRETYDKVEYGDMELNITKSSDSEYILEGYISVDYEKWGDAAIAAGGERLGFVVTFD